MAALTFTAASVLLTGAAPSPETAGGTVARGNLVRKNTSNQVVTASNDSATNADAYGIALADAGTGQPVHVAKLVDGGTIAGVSANCAAGKPLFAGTSGAINPVDDIAGSEYITVIGVGVSASAFKLGKVASGVAAAGAVS